MKPSQVRKTKAICSQLAVCAWGDGYQHLCSGRDAKAGGGMGSFGGTEKAQCALMEAVGLGNWLEVGYPVCLLGVLVWFSLAGPKSEAGKKKGSCRSSIRF